MVEFTQALLGDLRGLLEEGVEFALAQSGLKETIDLGVHHRVISEPGLDGLGRVGVDEQLEVGALADQIVTPGANPPILQPKTKDLCSHANKVHSTPKTVIIRTSSMDVTSQYDENMFITGCRAAKYGGFNG